MNIYSCKCPLRKVMWSVDVHLMNFKVELGRKGIQKFERSQLYHKTKCLVIIDSWFLWKTMCNKGGFVFQYWIVGITFILKNRLQLTNVLLGGRSSNVHVLFLRRYVYSSSSAIFHLIAYGRILDYLTIFGPLLSMSKT